MQYLDLLGLNSLLTFKDLRPQLLQLLLLAFPATTQEIESSLTCLVAGCG